MGPDRLCGGRLWGHGSNDAQKTMGVIAATLGAAGYITADAEGHYPVPTWVVFAAASMISIGTYWGGLGDHRHDGPEDHPPLQSQRANCHRSRATTTLRDLEARHPELDHHASRHLHHGRRSSPSRRRVNWIVMRDMATAWVVTMPITGLIGYLTYQATTISGAVSWAAVLSLTAVLGLWAFWLMTHAENADAQITERVEEAQEDLLVPAGATPTYFPPTLHGPAGHGEPPPPHTLA